MDQKELSVLSINNLVAELWNGTEDMGQRMVGRVRLSAMMA